MSTTTALAKAPEASPMTLLAGMDMSKVEPDKLEKLLDIQAKWEGREAEKRLAEAMAAFQRDVPSIIKSRKSHVGNFASLDDIMYAIRPVLADNGLSISFDTSIPAPGQLTAICHVMHSGGAKFNRSVTAPVDQKMSVNDTQKMGSAVSYCKRYVLIAALNLIVSDHADDDGKGAGTQYITAEQVNELETKLSYCPAGTLASLLEWAEAPSLATIEAGKFPTALKTLKSKIK